MSSDKLTLLFAAVERLAEAGGDTDLVDYLHHASHHSGEFIDSVKEHQSNMSALDEFTRKHEELTRPGGQPAKAFSQADLDAAVNAAVKRAMKERGKEEGIPSPKTSTVKGV